MIRRISLTRFSHFIIGYMILAFGWWAYHLWSQNDRLYAVEKQLLAAAPAQEATPAASLRLTRQWQSKRRMVVAEGLFFTLCLAIGLYIINRSTSREVALARQRRNFMLSITHELKSPIAGMRLVLETLGKRDLNREQLEKLCASGVRDASRLQHLVEDLLLAARLEDNWRPHAEPVDLAALARDCVASLQVRFPSARFHLHIPVDLPELFADKAGLGSVLQNLLENAVKYSPEGSDITLSATHLGGKTLLEVKDCGQGIPDNEKAAVFEKFYRVGNEETRRTSGTGLGLYIVKQVVRAHGGTIAIKNNAPQGTIFLVEL